MVTHLRLSLFTLSEEESLDEGYCLKLVSVRAEYTSEKEYEAII